ncbi:MAG: DUF2283 domain-containing protein [Hydrogenophaga sp.]|nr:DUF2283 domain-containing protein [Hydrogenophaga sp.]
MAKIMIESLSLRYDELADVLYVALGVPVPADTDEDDNGLLLRFALSDGHPCGVTVLGFREDRWNQRVGALSDVVATHLHIPKGEVQQVLARV